MAAPPVASLNMVIRTLLVNWVTLSGFFRGWSAVGDTSAREVVRRLARELVEALAALPPLTEPIEALDAEGGVRCLVRVLPAAGTGGRAAATSGGRAGCREDIIAVVRAARRALTLKEIVKALRDAQRGHGPGTVTKALAELTRSGDLVNPRDKRGYRLPEWRLDKTPSLFD